MNSPDESEDNTKWDSFETYKGEPLKELPIWLDRFAKATLVSTGLMIVFAVCGGFLWIVVYRYGGGFGAGSRSFALIEQPWMAWARFIGGGLIGVLFTLRWWLRLNNSKANMATPRKPPD